MPNTNSIFTGSIPEYYDKYLVPLLFEDYSIDLAKRLNVPENGRVLEIAAGTGIATQHLYASLPASAHLTVTDLNAPMLDIAKAKFLPQTNLVFQTANAQNLPFDDAHFDTIACQFGIMFFPDKQQGVNEAFRTLKSGGEYLFSVWDSYEHNLLIRLVNDTVISIFPDNPPPFLDIAYSYFNIDEIRQTLKIAGFGDLEIAVLPRTIISNDPAQTPLGFIKGNPLSLQIPDLGGNVDEVVQIVTDKISEKFGPTPIHALKQAIVFKAHKP